jgi:gluconolactonase
MKLNYRVIADGLKFPEGPVALADGSVLVVEIAGGTLTRVQPDGTKQVVAQLGGGPNGAAIGPDGHCYVCNNGGFAWHRESDGFLRTAGIAEDYTGGSIQRVNLETGAFETLYTHCGDIQLRGPNDIVFDADGGMWFTDFGKQYDRLIDRGALFYANCEGSLIKQVAFPMITPNGIGISPDGGRLYVAESDSGKIWAWPILGPGELAKEPWPSVSGGKFFNGVRGFQRYDSLAVEANGNVCVGTLVEAGISVYSPSGELLEFHEAPEIYCTNIAFGGPDMRTGFITLSGYGQLIAAEWPRPGLALNDPLTARG